MRAGGAAAAAATLPPAAQQPPSVQKATCKCNGGRCNDCNALCKRCQCSCPDKRKKRSTRGRPPKTEADSGVAASLPPRTSGRVRALAMKAGGGDGGNTPKRKALGKLTSNKDGVSPATRRLTTAVNFLRQTRVVHPPPNDDDEDCKDCMRRNDPDRYLALYSEEEEAMKQKHNGSDRYTTPGPVIGSVGDAVEAFDISDASAKKLPSVADRFGKESLTTINPDGAERTANILVYACSHTIDSFVGSASKDGIMASVGSKLLKEANQEADLNDDHVKLAKGAHAVFSGSKRNSIQKRTAGALLAVFVPPKLLKQLGLEGMASKTRKKGKEDYERMVEKGETLVRTKYSRQKISDDVIKKAVAIMLQPKFVGTLSWGVKDVVLDEEEAYGFPRLPRKCAREAMWIEYKEQTKDDDEKIHRSTFMNILGVLTSSEERILSSVDYVTGRLVNDPCETLQDVADKVSSGRVNEKLTDYIAATKNFLKVQYDGHAENGDGDAFHGLNHALSKTDPRATSRQCECTACKFPFYTCSQISEAVEEHRRGPVSARLDPECYEDALKVVGDIRNKFRLFMAHRCRVVNQQRAIATEEEDMIKECKQSGRSRLLVTIDWKMKFNQCSSREQTTEHYGKRGMSWHGVMVVYYVMEKVKRTSDDSAEQQLEEPVRKSFYIDQIVEGENKQNAAAVLGALEAALVAIHLSISRSLDGGELQVTLLSDNAGCYQSKDLIFLIQALNVRLIGCVFVRRLLHTETQDGKSFLDAHFGRATVHLKRFMKSARKNRIRRILTPEGLAAALAWDGGINNSIVQRISFDKDKLAELSDNISGIVKVAGDYFSRVNDTWFDRPAKPTGSIIDVQTVAKLKFDIRVQAFTGIGREVGFSADIEKSTFEPDAQGLEEIQRRLLGLDLIELEEHEQEEKERDEGEEEARSRSNPSGRPADYDFTRPTRTKRRYTKGGTKRRSTNANANGNGCAGNEDDEDDDDEEYEEESVSSSESENSFDSAQSWELEDDNASGEAFAAEGYRSYGDSDNVMYSASSSVTGVSVSKSTAMGEYATAKRRKKKKDGQISTVLLEARPNQRKDAVALGVREAVRRVNDEAFTILDGKDVNPIYDDSKDFALHATELTVQGWARRDGRGAYGATYLDEYRPLIEQYYLVGKRNSSQKMSPSIMREKLQALYPNRFSLPGETEIRSMISALIQNEKKKPSTKTREAAVPDYVAQIISDLLTPPNGNPDAKPAQLYDEIWNIVENKFGSIPSDFPEKDKIKSKISSMKSAAKKKAKSAAVN